MVLFKAERFVPFCERRLPRNSAKPGRMQHIGSGYCQTLLATRLGLAESRRADKGYTPGMHVGARVGAERGEMADSEVAHTQGFIATFADRAQGLLSNLAQLLYQVYCLPGEQLSLMLSGDATSVLHIAGLSTDTADSLIPWLAGAAWIGSLVMAVLAWRVMHDAYITARGYTRRIHEAWKRIWRNAARRSSIAKRTKVRECHGMRAEPTITEEIDLGELEHAVLLCYGGLAPGRALTATNVAESVGVSASRARQAFETLSMLQLIAVSPVSDPGDNTHRLTPQGESFLVACSGASVDRLAKLDI